MKSRKCKNTDSPLFRRPDKKKLPKNCLKEIHFKNVILNMNYANNCCYLKDESIFSIKYIEYKNNVPVLLGRRYRHIEPVPIYPCNSEDMKIFIAKG